MKRQAGDEKKYMQIRFLVKDLAPEYIKNSSNSIIRNKQMKTTKSKKHFEQTCY